MKKPILLTKKELLEPIEQALDRIEKIRQRKASNDDSIILEGLFVLAVSSFENSLSDTLRILFKHIPEKIEINTESLSKEDLLSDNPFEIIAERKILSNSYKSLKDYLTFFIKTTSIPVQNFFAHDEYFKLQEIKATRNLLIHNNLKINSIYKETAGKFVRVPRRSQTLDISQDYLYESIITIRTILQEFKDKLLIVYDKYTRLNAIQNLWKFIFKTPIMKFENEWEVDIEEDRIICDKAESSKRGSLSTSERMFFDIWLAHVNGMLRINLESSFYHLDSGNRVRLGYFLTVIDILKN